MSSEIHIGIDEAGRGCLAGPVVAAAVLLPPGLNASRELPGLADSKTLNKKNRDRLAGLVRQKASGYGVGLSWPGEIDEVNILSATFRAMSRAVFLLARRLGLRELPALFIDGNHIIPEIHWNASFERLRKSPCCPYSLPCLPAQKAIVKGDSLDDSIKAAAIMAKTIRDALMTRLDVRHPGYGFARHKGYGTKEHIEAIQALKPCPMHRLTFEKVRPAQIQLGLFS